MNNFQKMLSAIVVIMLITNYEPGMERLINSITFSNSDIEIIPVYQKNNGNVWHNHSQNTSQNRFEQPVSGTRNTETKTYLTNFKEQNISENYNLKRINKSDIQIS